MAIFRGYRYKLSPLPAQEARLRAFAGVTRLVYNLALEQRSTWGRRHRINAVTQAREVTQLRAEFDWIRDVSVACSQQAIRDLDVAFQNFFAGRTSYPRPRRRGEDDRFRFQGREVFTKRLNAKWSAAYLPKVGWVKYRDTRTMLGKLGSVTVSFEAGIWYVAFARKIEHEAPETIAGAVGIDRGVATTLVLSTGEMLSLPASLRKIEAAKRKAQRIASRGRRGSKRRARAQKRVRHFQAKQARIRRDFHHRAALNISRRFGVAVLEDLKTNVVMPTTPTPMRR